MTDRLQAPRQRSPEIPQLRSSKIPHPQETSEGSSSRTTRGSAMRNSARRRHPRRTACRSPRRVSCASDAQARLRNTKGQRIGWLGETSSARPRGPEQRVRKVKARSTTQDVSGAYRSAGERGPDGVPDGGTMTAPRLGSIARFGLATSRGLQDEGKPVRPARVGRVGWPYRRTDGIRAALASRCASSSDTKNGR